MKAWTLLLVLCACGGTTDTPVHPLPPPLDTARADAGSSAEDTQTPAMGKLSNAECETLFAHIFEIAVVAQQNSLPPEERPTDADVEVAKSKMRGELLPECVARTREELKYDCYMQATDRAGFQACDKS